MYRISFVTALVWLVANVESKPASFNRIASTSVSRCLKTAPGITESPTLSGTDLMKFKRQELGSDTCAYINDKPFTCAGSGACTSLRSESIDYVGCCYRAGYCDIYTACYDGGTTVGTKTNNPRILSCTGTRPFCATVLWPHEPKTAYLCADQPSTVTVDQTTESPTPSSTSEDRTAAPEPTSGPVPPDNSGVNPDIGSTPISDLTKGQKIGIGAGCGAVGFLFAAGLGYCCCCSKQRRRKKASNNTVENTGSDVSEIKPQLVDSQ